MGDRRRSPRERSPARLSVSAQGIGAGSGQRRSGDGAMERDEGHYAQYRRLDRDRQNVVVGRWAHALPHGAHEAAQRA